MLDTLMGTSGVAAVCRRGEERVEVTWPEIHAHADVISKNLAARRLGDKIVCVEISRVDPSFLPLFFGCARANVTMCFATHDLTTVEARKLQTERNAFIKRALNPSLTITEDVLAELLQPSDEPTPRTTSNALIAYQCTGGTSQTKVVKLSYEMIRHEYEHYREVVQPTRPVVKLCNTSLYWTASAIGQISIALAYQAVMVFCEDGGNMETIRDVIVSEKCTMIGVAPDVLDLLAPKGSDDLPDLDVIFTWGEKFKTDLLDRWRGGRVKIRDLLTSTEVWLTLFSDPFVDSEMKVTSGVTILCIDDETKKPVPNGERGKLLYKLGPAITPGYLDGYGKGEYEDINGDRYWATSDMAIVTERGLVFAGRCDMLAKDKGKWVDMGAVEKQLEELCHYAAVFPDGNGQFHAFVKCKPADVVKAKALCPGLCRFHVVDYETLPRHPVTHKPDRNVLLATFHPPAASWPLLPNSNADAVVEERMTRKWKRMSLWRMLCFFLCIAPAKSLASLAINPILTPYLYYMALALDKDGLDLNYGGRYRILHWLEQLKVDSWNFSPFGRFGFVIFMLWLKRYKYAKIVPWAVALVGYILTRCKPQWLPVFWYSIGHQMEYEGNWWLSPENWASALWAVVDGLTSKPDNLFKRLKEDLNVHAKETSTGVNATVRMKDKETQLEGTGKCETVAVTACPRCASKSITITGIFGCCNYCKLDGFKSTTEVYDLAEMCACGGHPYFDFPVLCAECVAKKQDSVTAEAVMLYKAALTEEPLVFEPKSLFEQTQPSVTVTPLPPFAPRRNDSAETKDTAHTTADENADETGASNAKEDSSDSNTSPQVLQRASFHSLSEGGAEAPNGDHISIEDTRIEAHNSSEVSHVAHTIQVKGETDAETTTAETAEAAAEAVEVPLTVTEKPLHGGETVREGHEGRPVTLAFNESTTLPEDAETVDSSVAAKLLLAELGYPSSDDGSAAREQVHGTDSDSEERRRTAERAVLDELVADGWLSGSEVEDHGAEVEVSPEVAMQEFLDQFDTNDDAHASGAVADAASEELQAQQWRDFEDNWFRTQTMEHFSFRLDDFAQDEETEFDDGPPLTGSMGAQLTQLLLRAGISEVGENTPLDQLDSLRMQSLASWIKDSMGLSVSAADVLKCRTPLELLALLAEAPKEPKNSQSSIASAPEGGDNELYRIWFGPGQFQLMGSWCLRKDTKIDHEKLEEAVRLLIQRHEALRTRKAFPTRVLSFVLDTAVLFQLSAPIYPWLRFLGPMFKEAWPAVEVLKDYREMYKNPLVDKISTFRCQSDLERGMKERRFSKKWNGENIEITLVEMNMHLEGSWVSNDGQVISLFPSHKEENRMVFSGCGWIGKLYTHCDPQWKKSPHGCPALFMLGDGLLWVRVDRPHRLIVYRFAASWHTRPERTVFFRVTKEKSTYMMSTIHMRLNHAFGDAMSYYPLTNDLLTFYRSLVEGKEPQLSDPDPTMLKLQNRLFEAFNLAGDGAVREDKPRYSLRGSLFKYRGYGYGYDFIPDEMASKAMIAISKKYGIPIEVLILGIIACAISKASRAESCDFTMYVPCRDGPGDQRGIGLFADWRDITVQTPFDCTIIGVIWDLHDKIRRREWTIFNCARKPERTFINFQLCDSWKRGSRDGFQQLHEDSWKHGENLWKFSEERTDMHQLNQPMSFNIEQESEFAWWISCSMDYYLYKPAFCRKMLKSMRDAFWYLAHDPVHRLHDYPREHDQST